MIQILDLAKLQESFWACCIQYNRAIGCRFYRYLIGLIYFREELDKQRAKENYQKMHLAGKTDEARADLARLALIRKQRDDAAKKRDEEKKGMVALLGWYFKYVFEILSC